MPNGAKSEFQQLKDRLRATWMAGDFGRVAKYAEAVAEEFVARRDLKPKVRVLDVACGSGNLAIPAAQAGAIVTGVDIAPNLLVQARERAKEAGTNIQFDEGDAEELPYSDASFDTVSACLARCLRPVRIGSVLATWSAPPPLRCRSISPRTRFQLDING